MEDCWAKEPNQRPLLGFVYSRLEAIFLSHCHGRIVDTGMYLTLNAKKALLTNEVEKSYFAGFTCYIQGVNLANAF